MDTSLVNNKNKPLKIGIVGAGPAGLYFALLIKKFNPAHQVEIVEQNAEGATYGFGVVFSGRALSFLRDSDPDSYADIQSEMQEWSDLTIVQKGEPVRIDGSTYSGISRLALLQILQKHCREVGINFRFETRFNDVASFKDCDLIVAADGVNSAVRQQYAEQFGPTRQILTNKYVWYGTNQLFDTLSLIFRQYKGGAYVAHCYRYSDTMSTFIVECDAKTWINAGFEHMNEQESQSYCEQIFKDDLSGHPLLLNKSNWLNFNVVTNRLWSYKNIVLLGDALRSVHFSIGSGTRMALEDAIALFRAITVSKNIPEALITFERNHRPAVDKLLHIAENSYTWYEAFHEKMELDAYDLAYDYIMRSGRISFETLQSKAPRFTANYQAQRLINQKQV